MIKGLNILLVITSLLVLTAVYALKYQTVETANEKLALERTIEKQMNDLSLLTADWAYLNQPGHIEPSVRRHSEELGLEVMQQAQYVHITDIPMRPIVRDDAAMTALFEAIAAGVDPIAVLIEANVE